MDLSLALDSHPVEVAAAVLAVVLQVVVLERRKTSLRKLPISLIAIKSNYASEAHIT